MKFTKTDFLNAPHNTIELDLWLEENGEEYLHNTDVKFIESCHITGSLYYDGKDLVSSHLNLEGQMVILDSISNEDLTVDFETESEGLYSFARTVNEDDDMDIVFVQRETIDLLPEILDAISFEAPVGYSAISRENYPKGEGWELITEADLAEEKEDPRWAKLKDFVFEDEED